MALDDLVITDHYAIPGSELELSFSRSSGAGGQNVNKVNTRAELRWDVGASQALPGPVKGRLLKIATPYRVQGDVLLITSQAHRSQHLNIEDCLEKLRALVARAIKRPKARVATKPSRAAKRRRLESKKERGQLKRSRAWRPGDS